MKMIFLVPFDALRISLGNPMAEHLDAEDGTHLDIEVRTYDMPAVTDKPAFLMTKADLLRVATGRTLLQVFDGEQIAVRIPTPEELGKMIADATAYCQQRYGTPPPPAPTYERLVELTQPVPPCWSWGCEMQLQFSIPVPHDLAATREVWEPQIGFTVPMTRKGDKVGSAVLVGTEVDDSGYVIALLFAADVAVSVHNELSGNVSGLHFQAGDIHGDVRL